VPRRNYTPDERAHALDLAERNGAKAAAEITGIPTNTIRTWAHRNGRSLDFTETRRAKVEAAVLSWEELRRKLANEIGHASYAALQHLAAYLQGDFAAPADSKQAKDIATVLAILVDKAQLLSGGATERTEISNVDSEIERLARELAATPTFTKEPQL
jgi:transposase-like protein